MKKRLALILIAVLVIVSALTVFAACDDPVNPNPGPGPNDNTEPTPCETNGHKYVDGVCTECNKSIASTASYGTEQWDKEHTINILTSQGQNLQAQMQLAIDAFEAKYPDWKIQFDTISGSYDDLRDQVTSLLQTSDYPDIVLCYPDHVANYMQNRKVVDLAKYIYSKDSITVGTGTEQAVGYTEEEIADFAPSFWAEGLASSYADYARYGYTDDTIFTLPLAKSTELMFYNKTALVNAGLVDENGEAKVPETWDELWEMCAVLRERYPTCTPLGYDSEANWFITMCEQNGWGYTTAAGGDSDHYLFYNEYVIRWLQDMQHNYVNNKYFVTRALYGDQYTSNLFKMGVDGGAIFCIGSSAGASNQNPAGNAFEVGVAHIPGSKVEDRGRVTINKSVISQGPSMVQFRQTGASNADEKEYMTFLFVKELLDPTFQAQYSKSSGYSPVRVSTFDIPSYAAAIEAGKNGTGTTVERAIYVASTMMDDFFTSPAFVGSSTARDVVGNLFTSIMRGSDDIANDVAKAIEACGGIIK